MTFYVARCYESCFFTELKSKSNISLLALAHAASPPISQHLRTPLLMIHIQKTTHGFKHSNPFKTNQPLN